MGSRIWPIFAQRVPESAEERTERSRAARKQVGESGRVLSDRVGSLQMRSGHVGRLAMLAQDAQP